MNVYDTQCGCKVFRNDLAKNIFTKDRFISKWLFDVEIFHRVIDLIGKDNIKKSVREISLKEWIDTDDSRIEMTYCFKLFFDLRNISKKYNKKYRSTELLDNHIDETINIQE